MTLLDNTDAEVLGEDPKTQRRIIAPLLTDVRFPDLRKYTCTNLIDF